MSQGDECRPAVILVEPQLGVNIGSCARAMLNCGLDDLRLVRPRETWPNQKARAAATGAIGVVDRARLFDSVAEAVSDLRLILATTARSRDLRKPVIGPRRAARELRACAARGEGCGVLFGPERTGLENEDVVLARQLVHVPLNPELTSLNLAQAVLLISWEWFQCTGEGRGEADSVPQQNGLSEPAATAAELVNFFEHLEQELDSAEFFRVPEKRARMIRGLRNLFRRAEPTSLEVRTLHGIVSILTGRRKSGERVRSGAVEAALAPGGSSSGPAESAEPDLSASDQSR